LVKRRLEGFEGEVEELLATDQSAIINRNSLMFDELAGRLADSIVVFGLGEVGRKTLAGLRRIGIEPKAVSDNNPNLWGRTFEGHEVTPPMDAARRFGAKAVFVVTIYNGSSARRQLKELGCSAVSPFAFLYWKYSNVFLPHASLDSPHEIYAQAGRVRSALALWSDDTSRHEYLAQLRWRLFLDSDGLPPPLDSRQIYFPLDLLSLLPQEVYVDCGAFDGTTLKTFTEERNSRSGDQIIAFEPDPVNFRRLQQYVSTLHPDVQNQIRTYQLAVGKESGFIDFQITGTAGSHAAQGGSERVKCAALDTILRDTPPTYIKMDIEGAELDALAGAQHIIRRADAVWAICLYHRQDHLWNIPLFISSLSHGYNFFLRRYAEENWELICYAIPRNRLMSHESHINIEP
jgi:FkbM family methyltransferase